MVGSKLSHDPGERFVARANAKFILFGEHAVVYGSRAVVCGIPDGATAWLTVAEGPSTLKLTMLSGERVEFEADPNGQPIERAFAEILRATGISSPISADVQLAVPTGAGLGSSAALAAACARAIRHAVGIEPKKVADAVAASERVFHETPSGIDETAALSGGLLSFQVGTEPQAIRPQAQTDWVLLLAEPGASTAQMVKGVRDRRNRAVEPFSRVVEAIDEISRHAIEALKRGELELLTDLVQLAHGTLVSFGVSTPGLERAREFAHQHGALATKITGSGGGGCIVCLMPDQKTANAFVDICVSQGKWAKAVTIREH